MGKAPDSVLRGHDALECLPALASLQGNVPTLDALARILASDTWPDADPRLTRAIDTLHTSGGRLRIDVLAKFVACSTRHLNRLFRRNLGLSTKTYAQLIQFHRALNLITTGNVPIIAAAFEAGYSDHAHMVRTFRRFGKFTPSTIPPELSLPDIFSR